MNLKLKYLLNRNLKEHSEKVFEGISNGRKKALDNWFNDKWAQLENIKNSLVALEDNDENDVIPEDLQKQLEAKFDELFGKLDEDDN